MSEKYLQHWMLLVHAFYILLQNEVSSEDIQKADLLFRIFVTDFVTLYDCKFVTYNIHCLTHIPLMVKRWGPCFCNAAFQWENFNGDLQARIHGSKNQGIELVNTIQLCQGTQILKARCDRRQHLGQSSYVVRFHNKMKYLKLTTSQSNMLSEMDVIPLSGFYRAEKAGQFYTCNKYKRQQKRNNYTICYEHSECYEYGEIEFFIECSDGKKFAFINCFEVDHHRMLLHDSGFVVEHLIPIKQSKNIKLICLDQILFKVIRVGDFVCLRPNKHEVNL
jgi:hypothetical protein